MDMLTREEQLRQQLAALEREYREKCEPIVSELAKIEARKPMPPILIIERTRRWGPFERVD